MGFGAVVLLVAAAPNGSDGTVKQEIAALEGRWHIHSGEYGGEKSASEAGQRVWHFVGNQLTRYVGGKKIDVLRVEIQPSEKLKHMDLVPVEGKTVDGEAAFVTRTKCLYSLESNELKVAFTFYFAPGTPTAERQQAIEYAKTRPKTFDTKGGDVMVLTLKREKPVGQPK